MTQTGLTTTQSAVGVPGGGSSATYIVTDPRKGVQSTKVQVQNATPCDLSIQIGADLWSVAAAQATTLPLVPNSGITITATNPTAATTPNGTIITLVWMLEDQEPPEPDGPLTSALSTGGSTGTPITNYALETGGHLQDLDNEFSSFSNSGQQVTYYDSDTSITLASGLLVMGSQGSTPGTAVPGNTRVIQTDSVGRLVIAPGSALTANVTIVGPLDASGNVKVDLEQVAGAAPNLAKETGGNLASLETLFGTTLFQSAGPSLAVGPLDPASGDAFTAPVGNGAPLAAIQVGAKQPSSGEIQPLLVNAAGLLETTDAADGSINTAVPGKAIFVAGSDGTNLRAIPVSVATASTPSGTLIVGGRDGSVNTQQIGVAVTGAAVPLNTLLVGGSDGTDIRSIAMDTGGQVKVLVENTPAVTISGTLPAFAATPTVNLGQVVAAPGSPIPTDAVLVGGSDGTDIRALSTDNTGKLQVAITGQPVEVKGGSVTSISVYPIGGTSQGVVTATATTITAFLSTPSAGTAYRIISVTVVATGNGAITAIGWKLGNAAMSATIAAGNTNYQTVLLNGQLWLPAYGSINVQVTAATPNTLFSIYYDVISTVTIT